MAKSSVQLEAFFTCNNVAVHNVIEFLLRNAGSQKRSGKAFEDYDYARLTHLRWTEQYWSYAGIRNNCSDFDREMLPPRALSFAF